jgi:Uma2 family endonuclease
MILLIRAVMWIPTIPRKPLLDEGKPVWIAGKAKVPYNKTMALAEKYEETPRYTWADYLEWDEDVHMELVDGEAVAMAPPSGTHQGIITELLYKIRGFLEGKPCKVYPAPYAVRLNPREDGEDDTIFEPDIVVVCDPSKLDKHGCKGAPDLVIEVLSPSTIRHDRIVKFRKYQQAGVREYWIVDPETQSIQACVLENGRYVASVYDEEDTAPVTVLPGCRIALKDIFTE